MSGYGSGIESEIESRSRGGRGICRALSVSVCFVRVRGRLANAGRVALGCSVVVKGRAGRGRIGKDRWTTGDREHLGREQAGKKSGQ